MHHYVKYREYEIFYKFAMIHPTTDLRLVGITIEKDGEDVSHKFISKTLIQEMLASDRAGDVVKLAFTNIDEICDFN